MALPVARRDVPGVPRRRPRAAPAVAGWTDRLAAVARVGWSGPFAAMRRPVVGRVPALKLDATLHLVREAPRASTAAC